MFCQSSRSLRQPWESSSNASKTLRDPQRQNGAVCGAEEIRAVDDSRQSLALQAESGLSHQQLRCICHADSVYPRPAVGAVRLAAVRLADREKPSSSRTRFIVTDHPDGRSPASQSHMLDKATDRRRAHVQKPMQSTAPHLVACSAGHLVARELTMCAPIPMRWRTTGSGFFSQ